MPITQLSGIANTIQLTMVVRRARVRAARRAGGSAGRDGREGHCTLRRGAVQFDAVSFRYKEDVPLIDDMSIDVAPGQMIAIVGPTGAGKTTLVNLLMRFYDVDGGAIRVDGVDIREHEARSAAADVRHGAPGHVALLGHDSREHRLRPRGRERRGHRARREGSAGRPFHPDAAGELRTRPSTRRRATCRRGRSSS